jgi:hypothetical protein
MGPHQKITPAWAEKLCFTVTATGSYEEAAQVAGKWGEAVDDSTLHALAQRVGQRAQEQTEQRLEQPPAERQPERPASRLAVLMVDGWMARFRGHGWGKKRTRKRRVDWHEIKTGVFYLHEQSAHKEAGRGLIQDKVIVHCQGDAMELGRRLNWEALRGGSGRARQSLFLGDGAPWIWNLKKRPVESRAGPVGLLPRQPASLESGAEHPGGKGTGIDAMDGTAFASIAPRRGGKSEG